MTRTTSFAVLIVFILSIFSCNTKPTEAPILETKISGKVLDKGSNNPLEGVLITTNPVSSSVTTDNSGTYTISDVEPGDYVITARKDAYNAASISVTVAEGKTASGDIQLETIKPELAVSVASIDFGTTQTTATVIISNTTSIGTINYSLEKSVEWLDLSASSGSLSNGTATITLTVSRTNLSFGNYTTILSITSNGGRKDIAIAMTVPNPNAPQLTVSPLLLDFGTNLSQLTFTIRNSGTGKIDWAASSAQPWITILPPHDSTRTEIDQVAVTVNRNSLSPADYTSAITVTSNAGSQTVNVKMTVPAVPSLSVTTTALDFDSTKTQLTFNINNGGTGSLNWTANGNQPWMMVAPGSGTNSGSVNVTINKSGLTPGRYSGTVNITSNGGNASVSVNMVVPQPAPPQPVTVTAGDVTTNSITISWTASSASDFSAYKVYYSTSAAVSENSTRAATILDKATLTYTVTGLSPNVTYYFRVFVLSSSQQTAGSNTVSAKTDRTFPSWQQVALPVNFEIQSVHYSAENNIWAGGYTTISGYNFPRIYQFNGSEWRQSSVQSQDSVGEFRAIAFRNNSEGWAATAGGRIYKYDGSTWKIQNYMSTSYDFDEAIGTSNDIWFYGSKSSDPLIYRWNGTAFSELIPSTASSSLIDLDFINSTTGFGIDNYGNSFYYNGVGWINLGTVSYAYTISGTSQKDCWAADNYYLYHYDGTSWKQLVDIGGNGISYRFRQIRMVSPTEGWALSSYNDVYYYNGTSWSKVGTVSGQIKEIKNFGDGNMWGIIYESGAPNKLMRLQ